ncbi:MAG: hypothetical protein AAGA76_06760 [Pseudomonadota bacterium]
MQERRKAELERRAQDRRKNSNDMRHETETGVVAERRSGDDRRNGLDRRSA